jgi:drug/metabolite transporter (DMT)-like permease
MIGAFLAFFGECFAEISSSLAKTLFTKHKFSFALYGVLTYFIGATLFLMVALFQGHALVLSGAALLFFGLRFFFEVIQSEVQFRALAYADRTTFGFLRTITIPLLLCVDLLLGYTLSGSQLFGIAIVVIGITLFFSAGSMQKKGAKLALFSALNAVITISLFKYNITHFHAIAVEQFFITLFLSGYFLLRVLWEDKNQLLTVFRRPELALQLTTSGIATFLLSFAYQYGPASLILAMIRASGVFWSLISGVLYFNEPKVFRKAVCCVFLVAGIFFMVL